MPSLAEFLPDIEQALADRYGGRPPVESSEEPFASLLRVVLSRSIDPRKAERILEALRDSGLLAPEDLAGAEDAELIDVCRQLGLGSGSASKWLGRLPRLARWYVGRSSSIEEASTDQLREELVEIRGIGPPTADAILLEGLQRPVYPVDRATYRILVRHGWIDPQADYDEARAAVESAVGDSVPRLRQWSAWFARVGAETCRARVARCERCPLRSTLPDGGPFEPDDFGE